MNLEKKNIRRRESHQPNICAQCGMQLSKNRLDGKLKGVRISFCSFGCHDDYMKQDSALESHEGDKK